MNDNFILILAILISAGIGGYLGLLFTKLKSKSEQSTLKERQNQMQLTIEELKQNLVKIENEREDIRKEKDFLNAELAKKNTEYENLHQQNIKRDAELEERQEQLRKDFKLLANEIFEEKSNTFKKESKENIENILNPLKEKIQVFEKKVEDSNMKNFGLHESLKTQLGSLKDLNLQMTKEATNLTKALKGDNKTQGNWGELVLERVLEKSGLEKDREYFVQHSLINDQGKRVLPDVIINLPQGKKMIIDSKVSLVAYEQYANSEDKELKKKFLTQHINSIKSHINDLSAKKYEDLYKIESPDFVLMFIPIEPALYLAQNEDKNFFHTAFSKNILLVSPTTLLSTLRTIDTIWSNEKQQENAKDIAKHATSLYGKFKNLLDDLETVGNRINSTSTAYQNAMKKLTGNQNLIKDIDKLEKLGISPKEKISQKWKDKASIDDDNSLPEAIIKRAEEDE
ncbi:DNA recombination protein RmuC [Sabulilitoribacter arenilitoris]|uniref:DNA recombination protein RmuC n=1 Tax=Wocania arenilitoris TaxID=2044858 RepID=A0AAE3EP65_9FLAO|nr:DNA recombination protein RmuC [Wocania arenilitoris]MCF7568556.1 DNA recombination protein RmuC [Wocania arenilitoris]